MPFWDEDIKFKKTGAEIKKAVLSRIKDLEERLAKRNIQLEELLNDKDRLRSYLVRERDNDYPHSGQKRQDTPSEEHQEITELCRRVCNIEHELSNLRMIIVHLPDDQEFDLTFEKMTSYGFTEKLSEKD